MSNESWYTNLLLFQNTLTFLLLHYTSLLGLLLRPNLNAPTQLDNSKSLRSILLRELLPISKYSCKSQTNPPDQCAVCLYEFAKGDDIRQLSNCSHVFHTSCVDRWMDHDQWTCPLCRTRLVPDDLWDTINESLWTATGVLD